LPDPACLFAKTFAIAISAPGFSPPAMELDAIAGVLTGEHGKMEVAKMGRGILLWLLGVPIPVIILLWLFFGR
jgi:hypothetical protein